MGEIPISEKDYLNPGKYIVITSEPNEMAEFFKEKPIKGLSRIERNSAELNPILYKDVRNPDY